MDFIISVLLDHWSKSVSVFFQLLKLWCKFFTQAFEVLDALYDIIFDELFQTLLFVNCFLVVWEELVFVFHRLVVHLQKGDCHILNILGSHSIFTVNELDDLISRCSDRAVILDLDIFQSFNKSSLDISCFGCLACCINASFSSSHSMKVEFLRCQSMHIVVLDKAFTLRTVVIFWKMGERSSVETKSNSFAVDILLTHTSHNLANVHVTSFWPWINHVFQLVVVF